MHNKIPRKMPDDIMMRVSCKRDEDTFHIKGRWTWKQFRNARDFYQWVYSLRFLWILNTVLFSKVAHKIKHESRLKCLSRNKCFSQNMIGKYFLLFMWHWRWSQHPVHIHIPHIHYKDTVLQTTGQYLRNCISRFHLYTKLPLIDYQF